MDKELRRILELSGIEPKIKLNESNKQDVIDQYKRQLQAYGKLVKPTGEMTIDDIGVVRWKANDLLFKDGNPPEYVTYKLAFPGKIDQEDVDAAEIEIDDADPSGAYNASKKWDSSLSSYVLELIFQLNKVPNGGLDNLINSWIHKKDSSVFELLDSLKDTKSPGTDYDKIADAMEKYGFQLDRKPYDFSDIAVSIPLMGIKRMEKDLGIKIPVYDASEYFKDTISTTGEYSDNIDAPSFSIVKHDGNLYLSVATEMSDYPRYWANIE